MARPKAPCGTYSAYKRHLREKSQPCEPCLEARAVRIAEQRAQRRSNSRASADVVQDSAPSASGTPSRMDQLEWNLSKVVLAISNVSESDPSKLAPLSKRHSELLAEIAALDAESQSGAEEDPFDAFLEPNAVVRITEAPSRKQA